jgi:hypothetical protein
MTLAHRKELEVMGPTGAFVKYSSWNCPESIYLIRGNLAICIDPQTRCATSRSTKKLSYFFPCLTGRWLDLNPVGCAFNDTDNNVYLVGEPKDQGGTTSILKFSPSDNEVIPTQFCLEQEIPGLRDEYYTYGIGAGLPCSPNATPALVWLISNKNATVAACNLKDRSISPQYSDFESVWGGADPLQPTAAFGNRAEDLAYFFEGAKCGSYHWSSETAKSAAQPTSSCWAYLPSSFGGTRVIDAFGTWCDNNGAYRAWAIKDDQTFLFDPGYGNPATCAGDPRPGLLSISDRWPDLPGNFKSGMDAFGTWCDNNGTYRAWAIKDDQTFLFDPGYGNPATCAGDPRPGPLSISERWPNLHFY